MTGPVMPTLFFLIKKSPYKTQAETDKRNQRNNKANKTGFPGDVFPFFRQ
jgi:hypothetical protein